MNENTDSAQATPTSQPASAPTPASTTHTASSTTQPSQSHQPSQSSNSSFHPAFTEARVNLRQDERKAAATFERADAIAEAVAHSGIADKIDELSHKVTAVNWILLGEALVLITLAMAAIAAPPTLIILLAFLVVMAITFGFRQHFVHQRKIQRANLAQLRQKVRIEHTPSMRRNSHGGYMA